VVKTTHKTPNFWTGRERFCSGDRLLLNPYVGCEVACPLCYAANYPFKLFKEAKNNRLVFCYINLPRDFDLFLKKVNYAFTIYLSPVADPLQPAEKEFGLTRQIVEVAKRWGLPVSITTRCEVDSFLLSYVDHFQFSLNTLDNRKWRLLSPNAMELTSYLEQIKEVSRVKPVTLRIDPIIWPYTWNEVDDLIAFAHEADVAHVTFSILDLPSGGRSFLRGLIGNKVDYYSEFFRGRYQLYENMRNKLLLELWEKTRSLREAGIEIGFCMEKVEGIDANLYFAKLSNSAPLHCDGVKWGVFKKERDVFRPLVYCSGNCLYCYKASCGLNWLAMRGEGRFLKVSDLKANSEEALFN